MKLSVVGLFTLIVVAGFWAACSSSSSSSSAEFSGLGDSVISSPFSASSSSSSLTSEGSTRKFSASFAERKKIVDDLLAATSADSCKFEIDISQGSQYADCYGPNVRLQSGTFADSVGSLPVTLPVGDTGIWNSSTTDGEACVAAQVSTLVDYHTKFAYFSQLMAAALKCFMKNSSISDPVTGTDVTFTADQLTDFAFTSGTKTFTPTSVVVSVATDSASNAGQKFVVEGKIVDGANESTLKIIFQYADQTDDGFSGTASYFFRQPTVNEGNCTGVSGTTPAGKMVFSRADSSSDVQIALNTATFCGTTSNPLSASSSTDIDACNKFGVTHSTDTDGTDGWGANWNRVVFNYNPDTLVGSYSYAWQAGRNDSHARVFNAKITDADSGVGYFGYGPEFGTVSGGACTLDPDLGKIERMICDWAVMGSSHTGQELLQKQVISKNASGKWLVESEKIRYVPQSTCNGTGTTGLYCAVDNDMSTPDNCTDSGFSDQTNDSEVNTVAADSDRLDLESISNYTTDFGTQPTVPTF